MRIAIQPANSMNLNRKRQTNLVVFTDNAPALYAGHDTANFLTTPSIRETPQGKLGGRA
jgi:hypothetical protein